MLDEKIIALYQARSEQAITETDCKYGGRCRSLAKNIVQSQEDAEECVNDAYLGAWQTIPPTIPNPLLTYLLKLVRNQALHRYWHNRADKRDSHYTLALEEIEGTLADEADIIDTLTAKELAGQIEAVLDTWRKTDRILFIKRYWFGDSYKAIAADMGMSEKNVSVRLTRLRQQLKHHLIEQEVLP